MTSWQDQQDRGGPGRTALDPMTGQPMSRRAAREAERRAAEAVAERQPHPSGVVDFEAHDFSSEFAPDQDFNVGDTQDIWAALTRGGQPTRQDTAPVRPGEPPRTDPSGVSGDLLDRVRDAVLRRGQEPPAAGRGPQAPTPPQGYDAGGTRRDRRLREAAEAREDGLPTDLFVDRGPVPGAPPTGGPRTTGQQPQPYADPYGLGSAPQQVPDPYGLAAPGRYVDPQPTAAPEYFAEPQQFDGPGVAAQPQGFQGYDYDDDGYYDEPYAPEPTIAIRGLRPMELDTPSSTTNPISLPQSFAEPVGDDALTFSSPVPVQPADLYDDHPAAMPDPSFSGPVDEWGYPQPSAPGPKPAQPPSPFLEPQQSAAFSDPRLGPPSEVTDLAGFEALIRKARQQPAQAEQGPVLAWADDEEVQEGFTGLLSRSVQGSHGSANALILPNDPQPDLAQAIGGTGDIFITGSMNLPRSLSTTGTTSAHDTRDMDRLFDAAQDEPAAGVAPVLAKRAISGESRVIVNARRGRGNVLPTVLAIVAGVMAVGVVTLLVASWASNLF